MTNVQIGFSPRSIIKKNKIRNKHNYKQKINTDNNKNNDEINFEEEKIIIDNWNNDIEKVKKDKLKSKNYSNNKDYLLKSESLVDERAINREIELNRNETNINKSEKEEEDYNYIDENMTKEEHIFIGDLNGEDEDDNKVNYKDHSTSRKPYLYISNSVLGDQIINRQLIKKDNEDNINKNSQSGFEDEETLSFNYGSNENESNEFSRIKTTKNNKCLYIQLSSIEDQITSREVNINESHKMKTINKKENSKPYIRKKIEQNNNSINSAHKNANSHRYFNYENEMLIGGEFIHNRLNTEGNEILKENFNL
jgi:hypothetical protein